MCELGDTATITIRIPYHNKYYSTVTFDLEMVCKSMMEPAAGSVVNYCYIILCFNMVYECYDAL